MPMVFCASLPPCPRLYIDAEISCMRRNHLSIFLGVERTKIHDTSTIMIEPNTKQNRGERTMNRMVFSKPDSSSNPKPTFATAAPSIPISACDDVDGIP